MIIKELSFYSYRNLKDNKICPCSETNIFFGDNAQGKTNLLEAIWLMTGTKSFRPVKEKDLVKIGEDFFRLEMTVNSKGRDQTVVLKYDAQSKKRELFLNKIEVNPARITEVFSAVVFSPEHLEIIKKGPEVRRKFIDDALCQLKPGCRKLINNYKRALIQRNNLLKNYYLTENADDMLDVFENGIAQYGAELNFQRNQYCKELLNYSKEFFAGLSEKKEEFNLTYSGSVFKDKQSAFEYFSENLKKERKTDISLGSTSVGPHRHDVDITVNGLAAKTFASQGQQRSCALAMKLAEAAVLESISGQKPVALLDDVMSELDSKRRNYIVNRLDSWQVFITTCNPEPIIIENKTAKLFNIVNGEIVNVSVDSQK